MGKSIRFGTDGWRDIIAEDFTYSNLSKVILAICKYLKKSKKDKKGIFIGYDNRFMSSRFARYIAAIMTMEGLNTYLSKDISPTPTTAFMVKGLDLDGSIMITASHNPPIYNGIKFIPEYAGPADKKITDAIESELKNIENKDIRIFDPKILLKDKEISSKTTIVKDFDDYIETVLKRLDRSLIKDSDIGIAVNTMYGAANKILPSILEKNLGKSIIKINNGDDPLFGGKLPDPSGHNLKDLKKIVLDKGLDIGIAVDGDADRFGVIDGKGKFISPNNGISIILDYLIKKGSFRQEDVVVRSIATTHLIDEICFKNEIERIETPVGFKHIGKLMLKGNVLIGGEESGGMSIKGHIPEKDGILATLMLIEIQCFLSKNKKGYLSDYLDTLYEEHGSFFNTRLDKEIPADNKEEVISYFRDKDESLFGMEMDNKIDTDGIKIVFKDKSWILIRPSGTEPLIRCYIESRNASTFELIKKSLNQLIKDKLST